MTLRGATFTRRREPDPSNASPSRDTATVRRRYVCNVHRHCRCSGRGGLLDELVVVEVVAETEAEFLCALLRDAGISCMHRQSNYGAGASDGLPVGGPQEVMVRAEDLASARKVLRKR